MTNEKGLDPIVADRIGEYVKLKGKEIVNSYYSNLRINNIIGFIGSKDLLEKLFQDQELYANKNAKSGLDDLVLLFKYLEFFEVLDLVFIIKHNLYS
jgi:histidyl-tRNA synthetase